MTRSQTALFALFSAVVVAGVGWYTWRAAHALPPADAEVDAGSDDALDQSAFAVAMLDDARAENPKAQIDCDAPRFALRWKEGTEQGELALAGVYREYLEASPSERMPLMHRRAAALKAPALPATLAEAAPHLVAVVRERMGFEIARIMAAPHPESELPPAPPHVALTDDLWGVLAYEADDQLHRIDEATLTKWNARFDDEWPKAVTKLAAQSAHFKRPDRGALRELRFDDANDSARILLPSVFAELGLNGDPVVAIPREDMLLTAGANDSAGIDALAARVEREWDRGAANLRFFRLAGGNVTPFEDPRPAIAALTTAARQRDETAQRDALTAKYGNADDKPFVAGLKQIRNKETNEAASFVVDTEDTPTLLPKADWVVFRHVDVATKTGTTLACGRWDRVYAMMKSRWKETPLYPPRWLATELPTSKELADLGCEHPGLR